MVYSQYQTSNTRSKWLQITVAAVASIAMVAAYASHAFAATSVVTPGAGNGWTETESGGTIEYVTSAGAMGSGALEFTTPTDASYTRIRHNEDVALSTINSLSYKTNQVSAVGDEGVAAVNLRLYVDTSGDGVFDDVLVYEPYYNGAVTTGWQTWNITPTSGYWWSNSGLAYDGVGGGGAGGYGSNFTLENVLADFPDATLVDIGLGTGDYNSPWVVQADALTVNDTTYDFEPAAVSQPVVVKTKAECKENGWSTLVREDGTSFKNQGQCVAYVTSNDNSKHRRQ